MAIITVHNKSGHDQEVEVHGWPQDNPHNENIGAGQTLQIDAPDASSGAIIFLHDGHEGEQAEITKGSGENPDYFDCSNICGAGGNITVQQVGEPNTKKGDPNFMQDCNTAWEQADEGTKDGLKDCVFCDGDGKVVRIDAPKNFPNLENWVRTFANGQTYIGVGAWNGDAGNAADNAQSSGANGIKDIIVTYNDENADPDE